MLPRSKPRVSSTSTSLPRWTFATLSTKRKGLSWCASSRDFPEVYAAQDRAGKAKLLKAIVQRVTLRAGEAEVTFQPPFDVLAEAGALLYNQAKWGE